jgi:hypothetical protein
MLELHFHCAQCGVAIAAEVVAEDGTVTPAKIRGGQQGFVLPSPEGVKVGIRQAPLCDSCFENIEAASKASKLIVPPSLGLVQ